MRIWVMTISRSSPAMLPAFTYVTISFTGLKHHTNSFNVVHGRLIATGITNHRALVGEAANILRPGGVYLSMEVDMQVFDESYGAFTMTNEGEPVGLVSV